MLRVIIDFIGKSQLSFGEIEKLPEFFPTWTVINNRFELKALNGAGIDHEQLLAVLNGGA
jgi:hypothetical protein